MHICMNAARRYPGRSFVFVVIAGAGWLLAHHHIIDGLLGDIEEGEGGAND